MSPSPNLRGIAAMCAAMALFVGNDAFVKLAAADLPPHQILFVRGLMATAVVGGVVFAQGAHRAWRRLAHPLLALRSLLEVATAYFFISALAVLGLAEATAIMLLSPLLITAFSAFFLGEDVRWRRWSAVGVGFLGMLLVLQPGGGVFAAGAVFALIAAVVQSGRDVVTRRLPSGMPTTLVSAAGMAAMTACAGLACLALPWTPVGGGTLRLLAASAVLVIMGNIAIIIAFRDVDISAVSPFRYTVIVWAVIAGVAVFDETPNRLAWLGIVLIVASGLYTMVREAVTRGRPAER